MNLLYEFHYLFLLKHCIVPNSSSVIYFVYRIILSEYLSLKQDDVSPLTPQTWLRYKLYF